MAKGKKVIPTLIGTALWLFLAASSPLLCLAGGAGQSGSAHLRILTSPRSSAMGEAGTGLGNNLLDSIAINPAGLGQLKYKEAAFSYLRWIEGMHLQDLAYALPFPIGTLALSAHQFTVGSFKAFDNSGTPVGEVEAKALSARLAFGGRLWGPHEDRRWGVFAGGAVRYLKEELAMVQAKGWLYDAGLLVRLRPQLGIWGFGMSVLSKGKGLRFDTETSPSPQIIQIGGSYVHPLFGNPLSLVLDGRFPKDGKKTFGLGLEYLLKDILAWRIGYTSAQDLGSGFRAGLGFNLNLFRLDYALASLGDFSLAHRVGISMRFGEAKEVFRHLTPEQERAEWHYMRALKFYKDRRDQEALLELDNALWLDPGLRRAKKLQQQIHWNRQMQRQRRSP